MIEPIDNDARGALIDTADLLNQALSDLNRYGDNIDRRIATQGDGFVYGEVNDGLTVLLNVLFPDYDVHRIRDLNFDGYTMREAIAWIDKQEHDKRHTASGNIIYPFEAECAVCHHMLTFDVDPGGTPGHNGDWGADEDYGCITGDDEGSDGHTPINIFWTGNNA